MADPEDLLGKADALMSRHRPPQSASAPYAEIPVLDEVVEIAADNDDLPLLTEYVRPAPMGEEQMRALAASIRESVLTELQPEVESLIEERLNAALVPLVERLLVELRGDLQLVAREILRDAIGTAVEQEFDRRKSGG